MRFNVHSCYTMDMTFLSWSWQPLTLILIALFVWLYIRGWLRLRTIMPELATRNRMAAFLIAVGLLLAVTVSPLYALGGYYLSLRSLQKVLICMLAAPLLLLACPFHLIMWGLPHPLRQRLTRLLLRRRGLRSRGLRRLIEVVTQSGIAWLIYLGVFLVWHEPSFVNWSSQQEWSRVGAIWLLLYASLVFWWHVTYTGPRLHKELPGWIIIACLIGVEIPNMFTGVSIAFSDAPIYQYYIDIQRSFPAVNEQLMGLTTLEDQMIGGGLTWVLGSAVYVTSIVMVLNKLFKREKMQPPILSLSTEPTPRTIAPGLEHRVQQSKWRQAGYDSADSEA